MQRDGLDSGSPTVGSGLPVVGRGIENGKLLLFALMHPGLALPGNSGLAGTSNVPRLGIAVAGLVAEQSGEAVSAAGFAMKVFAFIQPIVLYLPLYVGTVIVESDTGAMIHDNGVP